MNRKRGKNKRGMKRIADLKEARPIPTVGPTVGPTPTPPPPTVPPIGLTSRRYKSSDFPGRYVDEVPGIGQESIRRLTMARMKSLAALASADATHVARILNISEVRAMGFIYEARLLLQRKTKK